MIVLEAYFAGELFEKMGHLQGGGNNNCERLSQQTKHVLDGSLKFAHPFWAFPVLLTLPLGFCISVSHLCRS